MKKELRAWAEIHIGALCSNLKLAQEKTGRPVMAVIKGDAHGHGAAHCGLALQEHGAAAFAVACVQEAIELREAGITKPILILGWTPAEYASELSGFTLTQSVMSEEYAEELNAAASEAGVTVRVHTKLDTGMSRTGIFAQSEHGKAAEAICRIAAMRNLDVCGIFTHFAAADVPEKDDFTAWQLSNYTAVLSELEKRGFERDVVHHVGNSAGILYHPECRFDMVRAGVMLYGFYPNSIHLEDGPLEPVLTLKARVAQVKELPAGAKVSYGCLFEAPKPMKIAVVTAGYADAYPRNLTGKGAWAIIGGKRCPQIGRICMDMCMFDVTDADVKAGDEVILYGRDGMPMDEIAALAGTINCDMTCLLPKRVKKVYIEA